MKTEILYEDKDLMICYKPPGLATESGRIGQMDMVSELKNYLKGEYLGVVHRLDQPVEGILVFAKNKQTAGDLSALLRKDSLNKQYYAVVCGKPSVKTELIVDYLEKDSTGNKAVISQEAKKEARLQYEVLSSLSLEEGDTLSLLEVKIETGRFHQIRAQLAGRGLPLLGDVKYGSKDSCNLSTRLGVKNVALCAYSIKFKHPFHKKQMEFTISPRGKGFEYIPLEEKAT